MTLFPRSGRKYRSQDGPRAQDGEHHARPSGLRCWRVSLGPPTDAIAHASWVMVDRIRLTSSRRTARIVSMAAALGGAIYVRLILKPAGGVLKPEDREAVVKSFVRVEAISRRVLESSAVAT